MSGSLRVTSKRGLKLRSFTVAYGWKSMRSAGASGVFGPCGQVRRGGCSGSKSLRARIRRIRSAAASRAAASRQVGSQ